MPLFQRSLRLLLGDRSGAGIDVSGLRVEFVVTRDRTSIANLARVRVYNLSERASDVRERFSTLSLSAGYESNSGLIFLGHILNVFDRREGPDDVLELYARDGARDWQFSTVAETFAAGTTVRQIVKRCAQTFIGVQVDGIDDVPELRIASSRTINSPTHDILDELAASYGFEWSFQSGDEGRRIMIVAQRGTDRQTAVQIDAAHGLIGSPTATDLGIECTTLLNPSITPARLITIESLGRGGAFSGQDVRPVISTRRSILTQAAFAVYRVEHYGDTRGSAWYSLVSGRRLGD